MEPENEQQTGQDVPFEKSLFQVKLHQSSGIIYSDEVKKQPM